MTSNSQSAAVTMNGLQSFITTTSSSLSSSIAQTNLATNNYSQSLASSVTTLSSTINTNSSSLSASIAITATTLAAVSGSVIAAYTLAVGSGNSICGFKAINSGTSSSFSIQANQFYITDGSGNYATSPFIVTGGTVYITSASIQSLSVGKLTTGNFVNSTFTVGVGAVINSGQTAFNSGSGFWLSNTAGNPQFSVGNSTGSYLAYSGGSLNITGTINASYLGYDCIIGTSAAGDSALLQYESTVIISGSSANWITDVFNPTGSVDGRFRIYNVASLNSGPLFKMELGTQSAPLSTCYIYGACQANSFNNVSSIRFKENVTPILDAMSYVKKLQGVHFTWKDHRRGSDVGLIAEDVNKVLPQVVSRDADDLSKIEGVAYDRIVPILIEAIKELAAQVERLEKRTISR